MGSGIGPSWYSTGHLNRAPIMIDDTAGASSPIDVGVTVPAAWAEFWDNVQDTTNGYDVVVTGADGRTKLNFDHSGFSYANKTLTLQIDGYATTATGKADCVWVYWNKTSPSDEGTAVTITSAKTGYIEIGEPPPGRVVRAQPLVPGQTASSQRIAKDPNETIHVWFDLTDSLIRRGPDDQYNNHRGYEGIDYATPAGTPGGTITVTASKTRFVTVADRIYVLVEVSSGTSGNDEALYLTVVTEPGHPNSSARTLRFSCRVVIDDQVS